MARSSHRGVDWTPPRRHVVVFTHALHTQTRIASLHLTKSCEKTEKNKSTIVLSTLIFLGCALCCEPWAAALPQGGGEARDGADGPRAPQLDPEPAAEDELDHQAQGPRVLNVAGSRGGWWRKKGRVVAHLFVTCRL